MLKKKFGLFAAVTLAGSVFLAGCGDDATTTEPAEEGGGGASDPEFLSILTGGTTGTYYPLGGAMATIIENETGLDTTAEVSQASMTIFPMP